MKNRCFDVSNLLARAKATPKGQQVSLSAAGHSPSRAKRYPKGALSPKCANRQIASVACAPSQRRIRRHRVERSDTQRVLCLPNVQTGRLLQSLALPRKDESGVIVWSEAKRYPKGTLSPNVQTGRLLQSLALPRKDESGVIVRNNRIFVTAFDHSAPVPTRVNEPQKPFMTKTPPGNCPPQAASAGLPGSASGLLFARAASSRRSADSRSIGVLSRRIISSQVLAASISDQETRNSA